MKYLIISAEEFVASNAFFASKNPPRKLNNYCCTNTNELKHAIFVLRFNYIDIGFFILISDKTLQTAQLHTTSNQSTYIVVGHP